MFQNVQAVHKWKAGLSKSKENTSEFSREGLEPGAQQSSR